MSKYYDHLKHIFHEEAISQLNNVNEDINKLCISPKHTWYWLTIITIMIIMLSLWAKYWNVKQEIAATGLIMSLSDIRESQYQVMKNVELLQDKVKSLEIVLQSKQKLYHQHILTIDDLITAKNNYLQARNERYADSVVTSIIPFNIQALKDKQYALMFIDWRDGAKLHPGMRVNLKSSSALQSLHGRLISISIKPLSKKQSLAYLEGLDITNHLNYDQPVYLSLVETEETNVPNWTPINAKIILNSTSPLKHLRSKFLDLVA